MAWCIDRSTLTIFRANTHILTLPRCPSTVAVSVRYPQLLFTDNSAQEALMAGLDKETLEMVLDTLKKYGEKKLTPEYLLHLDHNDQFPHEVLKELYDPART